MKQTFSSLLFTAAWLTAAGALAQTAGRVENFSLTDATTGRLVSLADYRAKRGVVLVFTSNTCPYAKLYEARLLALAREYDASDIQFLFINANSAVEDPDEAMENMANLARQRAYFFPYLADREHKIADRFDATKAPEAFVLQASDGTFTLKYRGAIDDNPQVPTDVRTQYLREAIQAVVSRTNVSVVDRRATGCMIKKD